ncbi:MAG: hypothetical protein ACI9S8_001607 [Chlamydiales bacterium]|jgi:hypothetical protein
MAYTVALFGESEKGEYRTAYFCQTLTQLAENLGHPPIESQGLHLAVQTLLFRRNLIFFRVKEEGFSVQDYLLGLRFLENNQFVSNLAAICLPGVGDADIIEATEPVCDAHSSFLICSESDLYDFLTANTKY